MRRCWASLWSARAIAYRERQGFDHDRVAMAVVVQQIVPAEVSGILFTANPVSGARDEIVINAALASGRLSSEGLPPRTALPGSCDPGGTGAGGPTARSGDGPGRSRHDRATARAGASCPTHAGRCAVARLAQIGIEIEDHFGAPQDIEWANADGQLGVGGGSIRSPTCRPRRLATCAGSRPSPARPGARRWSRICRSRSPLFDELYLREGLEVAGADLGKFFRWTYFRVEDFVDRPLYTTINGYAYMRANYKPLRWSMVPPLLRATVDEFRSCFEKHLRTGASRRCPPTWPRSSNGRRWTRLAGPTNVSGGRARASAGRCPLLVRLLRGASRREDNGRTAGPLSDDGGARARSDQRDVPARLPIAYGGRRD